MSTPNRPAIVEKLTEELASYLLGEHLPLDIEDYRTGEVIIPANKKVTKALLRKVASRNEFIELAPSPLRCRIRQSFQKFEAEFEAARKTKRPHKPEGPGMA